MDGDRDGDRPDPVKRPTPVRQSRPGGGPPRDPPAQARGGASDTRPTPVRESLDTGEAATEPDPDGEPVTILLDDREWHVKVRGRASAGGGPTPLLLLGFFDAPDAAEPRAEALVVGRRLAEMTERQIESAFRIARPPAGTESRPFFPEATSKGRRGDG